MPSLKWFKFADLIKQESHDGPEVAHLYIAPPPRSGASLNPMAFI
jgi:hypothetical protein